MNSGILRVGKIRSWFRVLLITLNLVFTAAMVFAQPGIPDGWPLSVSPDNYAAEEAPRDTFLALEFEIINHSDAEIQLRYIYAQCDCSLTVPGSAVVPENGKYVIKAEVNLFEVGQDGVQEFITILTDHPAQPEIIIPVNVNVRGREQSW